MERFVIHLAYIYSFTNTYKNTITLERDRYTRIYTGVCVCVNWYISVCMSAMCLVEVLIVYDSNEIYNARSNNA